jgi:hypothetical protein
MDVDDAKNNMDDKPDAKVIVVTSLTRNVVEAHLRTIFSFYGEIVKVDLPLFGKCILLLSTSGIMITHVFETLQLAKTEVKLPSNSPMLRQHIVQLPI